MLQIGYREKWPLRTYIRYGLIGIFFVLTIAGWWYWGNYQTFGDPTGTEGLASIYGNNNYSVELSSLFSGLYRSFWAVLGWFNIPAPDWYYALTAIVCAVASIGWLQKPPRTTPENRLILSTLFVFSATLFISWYSVNLDFGIVHGRLFFPLLSVMGILLGGGLARFSVAMLPRFLMVLLAMSCLLFSVSLLYSAYHPQQPIESIPERDNFVATDKISFDGINLLGYEVLPAYQLLADEQNTLEIHLYWQPSKQTDVPRALNITVFGLSNNNEIISLGGIDTYPSGGLRLTTTWQPDMIYRDSYRIELDQELIDAPLEPRIQISWFDYDYQNNPPQSADSYQSDLVEIRDGSLVNTCERSSQSLATFQDFAILENVTAIPDTVSAGDTFIFEIDWHVIARQSEDYNVLVHVEPIDEPENRIANGDKSPRDNWYPTTAWEVNSCFNDTYTVTIPEDASVGNYGIYVGFYNQETGQTIPLLDGNPNGRFLLDEIVIEN